jgi:hypothetical protein
MTTEYTKIKTWPLTKLTQAQAHASRIMHRGLKAMVLDSPDGWEVWQEAVSPDFGVLAEPEWVQELTMSEDGQKALEAYGVEGTWAAPASLILARRRAS